MNERIEIRLHHDAGAAVRPLVDAEHVAAEQTRVQDAIKAVEETGAIEVWSR